MAEIRAAAIKHDVPVELIVATICTESAGGKLDREAVCQVRREEPDFVSDAATPGHVSVGCMQTLLSTAAEFLMRPVTAAELQDPGVSIDAGPAVIAAQFWATTFDPPIVAAAYNAGGVYHDPPPANCWRMRCYPAGTGAYVDRFVAWFNDAMRLTVTAQRAGDAASFVNAIQGGDADGGPSERTVACEEGWPRPSRLGILAQRLDSHPESQAWGRSMLQARS